MDRDIKRLKKGHEIAFSAFHYGAKKCVNEDELAGFVRMICTMCAKTIHGMEGQKFKKDFLRGAISDNEKIVPTQASQH